MNVHQIISLAVKQRANLLALYYQNFAFQQTFSFQIFLIAACTFRSVHLLTSKNNLRA